jgi:hypothetical protein
LRISKDGRTLGFAEYGDPKGAFLGSNAKTEVDVSSAWTRTIPSFPQTQPESNIVNTMQGLFWREVGAFQRKLWQSSLREQNSP